MNPNHQEPEPVYLYGPPPIVEEPVAETLPEEPARVKRPWRRTVLVTVLIVVAMAALGALLGLLWSWLAPTVPVVNAGSNGIVVNDPSPEEYIAADGWFTIISFVFGLVASIAAWLVLRRDRGPAILIGVVLGGLVSSLTMWQVGRLIGRGAWNDWQQASAAGDHYGEPPDLHAHGALLVTAFAAVIVTTLLAGWSNDPDLDLPGAKPGYGHDLDHQAAAAQQEEQFRAAEGASSGSPDGQDPTTAPEPHAPSPADPPRG
ncbi:DUF2567 domain-containing protein [Winogradskya humida]|uniref:Membrane protein (TIGR02234 family) n=1 Tax=Winogradskya humida TaxID=113566 RepID=A0ABQ3ZFK7_9ACTN|nr:DUF2567 domain-containing protein [Actinoplanes humidus]GIE17373.1 hypothetical protein Ahu01nite_004750 [Actinoplanes humidus]